MRNILVSCDHGLFIINRFDGDINTFTGQSEWLLQHGNSCTIEASIAVNHITTVNPVIFDIGANIGTFTSWVAKSYPNGKIYAFEPQRLVYQIACGNMAINNFDNVYLYNMGLGNTNKQVKIDEPDYNERHDYGTYSLVYDMGFKKSKFTSLIDVVTLDWFVSTYRVERVDFLKIDAEGMDVDILIGARDTISKFKPVILVEHTNINESLYDDVFCELRTHGYSIGKVTNNLIAKYE